MIPVPVLTPYLSSLWLGLVTPVYARIGRKLVEGLRNPTVVEDPAALEAFPIRPRGLKDAIARAMLNEDREFAETRWADAFSSGSHAPAWGGVRFGSRIVDFANRHGRCARPSGIRTDPADRRPDRLVLRELAVADSRPA